VYQVGFICKIINVICVFDFLSENKAINQWLCIELGVSETEICSRNERHNKELMIYSNTL